MQPPKDPLQEGVRASMQGARRGVSHTTRSIFSFTSFKFFSTLAVVLLVVIGLFSFGVFGDTKINLSLATNPDLARGLVGHWTFDGAKMVSNVGDSSGLGHAANLVGQTSTTTGTGRLGQSIDLDGFDDYIVRSLTSALTLSAQSFSVSLWVYPRAVAVAGQPARIISWYDGSKNIQMAQYSGASNQQRFYFYNLAAGSNQTANVASTGDYSLNNWHHIVGTFDGNSSYHIYVDGTLVDGDSATGLASYTADTNVYIGQRGNGRFFNGKIDDVRIYNRALSQEEITRLYQVGATTKIATTLNTNPNLQNGLIGHWTFDGAKMVSNVGDSSGQGNNGTLSSGFTSTTTVPGNLGQGLLFDGSDDYVTVGSASLISALPQATVSAWIKPNIGSLGAQGKGIYSESNVGGTVYHLGLGSGNVYFSIYRSGTWYDAISSAVLTAGNWYHIVGVLSSSGMRVYINGVQDGTNGNTLPSDFSIANVVIGNFLNVGAYEFDGAIDDVRIYNRALSQEEITRLYQVGATTKINTSVDTNSDLKNGLVGYWSFDGNKMYTNVGDSSGKGNNGSLVGQTATSTLLGALGQALYFDGSDDYIQTTSSELKTAENFTVSVWFKANSLSAGHLIWQGMAAANGWGNGAGVDQEMHFSMGGCCVGSGNFLNFYLGNIDNLSSVLSIDVPFSDTTNWNHAVAVVQNLSTAPTVEVYFNGVSQGTDSTATLGGTSRVNWDTNLRMGRPGASSRYFNGSLDDVRIYNRALTAAEIQRLYNLKR